MLVRTKSVQLTAEELDVLLTGRTDNGNVDTLPEIVDYLNGGGSGEQQGGTYGPDGLHPTATLTVEQLSTEDLDLICV